ncbi:MAG: phosphate/phosphite/phosphonate ABC transporter substrate-binding protein [Thermodesulfobacteria bacterium]|nr:phosphate/phosphite/phosphonate ABC transporter substrate-binding protein [Thermodesulfobacteriota bacterium]
MRITPILLTVLFITSFFLFGCKEQSQTKISANEKPIRIGFMICDSREESKARFAPLTAYLSEKTGRKFQMVLANTYEFEDLVRKKKVDFVHVNSIIAVILNERYGVKLLAVDIRGRDGYKSTGTIISLKGSGIKTIEDMKGKSMIFGPALAPFGYMAQYALLLKHGFDPETDLSYYAIPTGAAKHEKVIYGVYFGKYDVGAAPRIDLDKMIKENKVRKEDFNIIAESIPMPYCTIGVLPDVDPNLSKQVLDILLNLKKDETVLVDGEVLKVLKRMWVDGFVKAKDKEYDPIRERLKLCNMAPYRKD